ncbi:SGNH/GDSL hydrolase family protein [bacterium]|nr:SGNH/GDSL hydrolase family protein [bacterium]
MPERLKAALRFALIQVSGVVCILMLAELLLRVLFGMPLGLFAFTLTSPQGMYPPNARIPMVWGKIAYVVETNSFGLRGREISRDKPRGTVRIAAIGDSATDGFYVDNPDTYPWILQDLLQERGHAAEVINAARGGASIDKEFAILREVVLPLDPDLALIAFVTNDINGIVGKSRPTLLYSTLKREVLGPWDRLRVRTAVGETVTDLAIRIRDPGYRRSRGQLRSRLAAGGERRYRIRGGRNFEANAKLFDRLFSSVDGAVSREPFDPQIEKLIDNYLWALAKLKEFCRDHGIELVFIYFPSYPQVYDEESSTRINGILGDACEQLSIPFLDLTEVFRREGRDSVLHLAPLDFHPNPAGNRVFARAVADFLEARDLL